LLHSAKRLILGILLIVAAAAVLVLSDKSNNRQRNDAEGIAAEAARPRRIAVIQISSIDAMNVGRDGMLERLNSAGFGKDAGTTFDFFNAEGDIGTLGQMAAAVCSASPSYDMVVSLSTVATQAVMRANKRALPHVFGLVASPPGIGIPIGPWAEGSTRPANVAGFGTLQPAEILLGAMHDAAPHVKTIGCVWNPAEPNAEASVKLGRQACAKLGIELLEANGANVSEVSTATDVLLSRGIECFWILADTNVIAAAPTVVDRCRKAGVPVITNFPAMAKLGAAINFGADYHAMGVSTGAIAELVLRGTRPQDIPCENFVPVGLQLNYDGFGIGWAHIPALAKQAEMIYDEPAPPLTRAIERPMIPESVQVLLARLPAAGSAAKTPAAPYIPTIAALTYNRTPNFEESYRGFLAELAVLGYVDGKNCHLSLRDAQLDIGTLGTIIAAIDEEEPDVVVPFTTPALQAVVRRITDRPVVFCMIASGVASGAGKSNTDHLPNVTGALITFDWEYMIRVGKAAIPNLRRVGTVFAPGEVNSVFSRGEWEKALAAAGIELVSVGADRPTELPEAADGLATQGVQAIMQISDSSSSTGFGTIVKAADRADIPVFAFAPGAMKSGATIAVSRDFEEVGRISARLMDKVLRGESPGNLPFADPQETVFLVNLERMKQFGIVLPKEMLDTARAVTEGDGASK
jgi:ABC-type uncharacterized transport system substrate-binding protein